MRQALGFETSSEASSRRARVAGLLTVLVLALVAIPTSAHAAPVLTIEPLSWNVIGLDSNSPETGPDLFPVGARVCNTGDAVAPAVSAQLVWDSANPYVNIDGLSTIASGDLAPGACADEYFHVRVVKDADAFDTTRGFHITAGASGVSAVSTPADRELYVEHIISQERNSVLSTTSSAIDQAATSSAPAHATVFVGHVYDFTVNAKTATGGYEQMETFATFPSPMFRILGVDATYDQPTGATNDSVYADACGWDNEIGPTPPAGTYLSCKGPENYTDGKAGGNPISVTYTVVATATGSGTLQSLIYDYSGSSFHYNSDYSDIIATGLEFDVVVAPDVTVTTSHGTFTEGGPGSYDIDVTNAGGFPTSGPITVTDTLPDGVTYTGASGPGWVCSAVGQVVTCVHAAPLAPGASAPIHIDVTVGIDPPEPLTNTVTVTNGSDDVATNNDDTDVAAVDHLPHLAGDSATTPESTPVTIDLIDNDNPGDGALTVTTHTDPAHGDVTCTSTGCTYTPTDGYVGPDSFDYTASDADGDTDTATVTVTVTPAPPAPTTTTTSTTAAPTTTTAAPATTTTAAPTTTTTAAPTTTTAAPTTTTTAAPATTTTAAPATTTTSAPAGPTTTTAAPTTTTTVAVAGAGVTTTTAPPDVAGAETDDDDGPPILSLSGAPAGDPAPNGATTPTTVATSSDDSSRAIGGGPTLPVTGADALALTATALLLLSLGWTLRLGFVRRAQ
ncbi:MAG: hypothetical protein QOG87_3193 [Actinomycetota bacterium]